MTANRPQPRPGVLDIAPYVPGKSTASGVAKVFKLSSNETPLGPSPNAIAAYRAVVDDFIAKAGGRIFNTAGDAVLAGTLNLTGAINDAGQIVGRGTINGPDHAFLLNPVTTPAAAPLATAIMTAPASGPIHPTTAAPSASSGLAVEALKEPGRGSWSGPAGVSVQGAAPSSFLSILDFSLADLAARPRARTVRERRDRGKSACARRRTRESVTSSA